MEQVHRRALSHVCVCVCVCVCVRACVLLQSMAHTSRSQEMSKVQGKLGIMPHPGSEVVLDRATNTVVPCDPKRCPYATRCVRCACMSDLLTLDLTMHTVIPARECVSLRQERAAPALALEDRTVWATSAATPARSTHGLFPMWLYVAICCCMLLYVAVCCYMWLYVAGNVLLCCFCRHVNADGSVMWVNVAPLVENSVYTINANLPQDLSFFTYQVMSYLASAEVSTKLMLVPDSGR